MPAATPRSARVLHAEEVHYVLVHAKSRLRRYEDDHLRIIGRAHTKRLIEVWLREESSDYWGRSYRLRGGSCRPYPVPSVVRE